MKSVNFKVLLAVAFISIICVNEISAQSRNDKRRENRENKYEKQKPLVETYEVPCTMYDDPENYAAHGTIRVFEDDFNTGTITKLLRDCQAQLKEKIGGAYKKVTRDYIDQMDFDAKSNFAQHIESAGELIIDKYLNDTEQDCFEQTATDDAGYIRIYMGILVKKAELTNKLVEELKESKSLSADEREKVRQSEATFRESAFKVFENDEKLEE